MRKIDAIVLHCSATESTQDIDASVIRKWHMAKGWKDIGYHYVIRLDGSLEMGRPLDVVGSHVQGHNATTIGIVYVGGLVKGKPADTMTMRQHHTFLQLVEALRMVLGAKIPVHGHNEYTNKKACPSFDVRVKYGHLN